MLEFKDVSGEKCTVLKHFSFSQEKGTSHILLSQDTIFLDELQDVITGKKSIGSGKIILNGQKQNKKNSCFITRSVQIYKGQSIVENVFIDKSFFEVSLQRKSQVEICEL